MKVDALVITSFNLFLILEQLAMRLKNLPLFISQSFMKFLILFFQFAKLPIQVPKRFLAPHFCVFECLYFLFVLGNAAGVLIGVDFDEPGYGIPLPEHFLVLLAPPLDPVVLVQQPLVLGLVFALPLVDDHEGPLLLIAVPLESRDFLLEEFDLHILALENNLQVLHLRLGVVGESSLQERNLFLVRGHQLQAVGELLLQGRGGGRAGQLGFQLR